MATVTQCPCGDYWKERAQQYKNLLCGMIGMGNEGYVSLRAYHWADSPKVELRVMKSPNTYEFILTPVEVF